MKLAFTTLAFLLASSNVLSQTISLDASGVKVFSRDSLEITNIKIEGESKSIKATFKFNPEELKFVLQSAEFYERSRYATTPDLITIGNKSFSVDPNSHCLDQFGSGYRNADWKDIKNDINGDAQNAIKITAMVPDLEVRQFYISYNNQLFTDRGYPYLLGAQSGGGLMLSDFRQNNQQYLYVGNIDQILAGTFAITSFDYRNLNTSVLQDFTKWGVLCINTSKNLN